MSPQPEGAKAGVKTILVIGTYDTKSDELSYLEACIRAQGGQVISMDVSVLGDPPEPTRISKHKVAEAAGSSIQAVIDSGDENSAMQIMAQGASVITEDLYRHGHIDGMIAMGGSMGTDLALDCAQALPLGVPKYIISTIAFSSLIPPERLAADIQMILWAGGLYGLNSICKSSLSQAAGAVLGAAQAVERPDDQRPLVGMTSLGSSCLRYMKKLKPALAQRGYEVAIFHSTGMGGMAFENLAAQGRFACVMDFSMQEFANGVFGSLVSSGAARLRSAGQSGTPQIVAPGAADLLDFAGWQEIPPRFADDPFHAHNRLIKSTVLGAQERVEVAEAMAACLRDAKAPVHFILPNGGHEEWDKPGGDTHMPEALAAMNEALRRVMQDPIHMTEIDAHINDQAFVDTALAIFDDWRAKGIVEG